MAQIFFRIFSLLALCVIEIIARLVNPNGTLSLQSTRPAKLSKVPTIRPTTISTIKSSPTPSKTPSFRPNILSNAVSKKPTTSPTGVSAWSQVNVRGEAVTNPILLTDGRVMLFGVQSGNVYLLTPDSFGRYRKGAIKQIASLPTLYCPLYFASATLPDGRVIIAGGEYSCGSSLGVWTNRAAMYDPLTNIWISIPPPVGTYQIGDAASVILPDGTFLLQDFFNWNAVAFNAATLTWTRKLFKNKKTW